MMNQTLFPPLNWYRTYRLTFLQKDLFSGVTLAAYAIPVSMAYASLAGLPLQYGIYGYLVGGICYALFGTGMQLSVGPTSAISLMIGTSLMALAGGDPQEWIRLASLTAMMVAAISLVSYFLRLNTLVSFISESVLLGFKAGAALTIGMTQLPMLFGVKGGSGNFFERLSFLVGEASQIQWPVFFFGLLAIGLLVAGQRLLPGRPVAILLVITSLLLVSYAPGWMPRLVLTGDITSGLPRLSAPSGTLEEISKILPLAFACFLLAFIETASSVRTLAPGSGYEADIRQELLALSAANAATSVVGGFPVSGGLSQSFVNRRAGAKSPISLLFASVTIGFCLLYLTHFLRNLPLVVLTAILLVAISRLVDPKGLKHLWRLSKSEFGVSVIAFLGVLMLGMLQGVVLASVVSVMMVLMAVSDPHIAFLGRIPGTVRYTDIGRHPDNERIPGLMLFRVEASVLYFNIDRIRDVVTEKRMEESGKIRFVIWDFSTSPYLDAAGADWIRKFYLELKREGIVLKIADAHASVRDMLRKEGLEHLMGHISRKVSVDDLVQECLALMASAGSSPATERLADMG
ncbi:MAG: SulP family inorganic anion transporter [Marinilabiliales bacterium]|nr:SulP family inorganic anion transporter [Marinilabiliales bacterium]